MERNYIGIRDVNEEIFRKFKAMSVEEKMKLGEALTKAMSLMLTHRNDKIDKKRKDNLINIKPIKVSDKKVNWSSEIDSTIYN